MDPDYQVTTIAGNGQHGFQDGNALNSMFHFPAGICCSNDGKLYVSDQSNHRIRIIDNNQVTTIAGNGQRGFRDGNALEAMFYFPTGICCSNDGKLYVSDQNNHRIRMIDNNKVTTIAGNGQKGFQDGNALDSMFKNPTGICCSNDGKLYVVDLGNQIIRMIYDNQVTTIAGNGQCGFQDGNALDSMFYNPTAICCSKDGRLYVTDYFNHRIRMIYNNQVITIAGNGKKGFQDGNALNSMFKNPTGICCSTNGKLYIVDQINNRIRMVHDNQVTTIAGNGQCGFQDGNALESMFDNPAGICCSKDGKLYIIDQLNHTIRMIHDENQTILEQSKFGFAHLLDMKNTFADREISFKGVSYHLHSTLVNMRCPLLFDQSEFVLIEKSNISNKSFDSFVTFLYSDRLTQQYDQTMTTMSIEDIVGLILIFDLLMDCKWILINLKKRFDKQLLEMLKIDQEESVKKLIVELLPFVYNLKEMINKKPATSKTTTNNKSYIEYCYNKLIDELQKKRSMITKYLANLQQNMTNESFLHVVGQLLSETCQTIEPINDESMIDFEAELIELSKLAFYKTNICAIESKTETKLESSISSKHLNEWTRPDFVIKLSNDDDESISYHVHKMILCGRWKYFCQMIESGLKEANDNEMTLSDDWNKSRFEKMMKYIYLNEIEFDELKDVAWLMNNRQLYGITVKKSHKETNKTINNDESSVMRNINKSQNNDESIVNDEIVDETGAYGFEALYDHCISLLRQPLTLSNCISLYLMFEEIGIPSLVQQSLNYISDNFSSLINNEATCREIRNISEHEKVTRLLFAYFDKKFPKMP